MYEENMEVCVYVCLHDLYPLLIRIPPLGKL